MFVVRLCLLADSFAGSLARVREYAFFGYSIGRMTELFMRCSGAYFAGEKHKLHSRYYW